MELWQQILMVVMLVAMLFWIAPNIKGSMERSRNAEEKHWGSIALLAIALIGFVLFLISTVQ